MGEKFFAGLWKRGLKGLTTFDSEDGAMGLVMTWLCDTVAYWGIATLVKAPSFRVEAIKRAVEERLKMKVEDLHALNVILPQDVRTLFWGKACEVIVVRTGEGTLIIPKERALEFAGDVGGEVGKAIRDALNRGRSI